MIRTPRGHLGSCIQTRTVTRVVVLQCTGSVVFPCRDRSETTPLHVGTEPPSGGVDRPGWGPGRLHDRGWVSSGPLKFAESPTNQTSFISVKQGKPSGADQPDQNLLVFHYKVKPMTF